MVRRLAKKQGFRVIKSRKDYSSYNYGLYMLVNDRNAVVLGSNFDASSEDIQDYLTSDD